MSRTTNTRRLAGAIALTAVLAGASASGAHAATCVDHRPAASQTRHADVRKASRTATSQATSKQATSKQATSKKATSKKATTKKATTTQRSTVRKASAGTPTTTRATATTASLGAVAASTITSSNSAVAYAGTTSISTSGLSANAVKVLQAVNATFPQVTDIGGVRSGSDAQDHGTGHALDLMTSDKATGDEIAAYLQAHASELGIKYVIWRQHIWSVQRSGEGWRAMADRGSATANHYDHVHVSVN